METCGLHSGYLSYSVQGGSKRLSLASCGEGMPVSFSTDFQALNSHKPQVSNHFHSYADIRYQSPFTKVTGFACASKISAAVRVIDCSVCLAIFRHHGGLREPQKVSLNLSLKLCHPFFPFFPTELIRSQLFSCSGVKFLSVPFNQPPHLSLLLPLCHQKSQTLVSAALITVTY